jgi:hypothetical protein
MDLVALRDHLDARKRELESKPPAKVTALLKFP